MPHNSTYILGGGLSSTNVTGGVCFVSQEAKGNARWYLEAMREGIDPVFHATVVVEAIAIKIAKLIGVQF